MSKIVCLLAFVALFQAATALKCYSCDKNSCQGELSTWTKLENCGNTASPKTTGACLKHVYIDQITKKPVTLRRCVVADQNGNTVSYQCDKNAGEISSCEVCTSDWCNSASSVKFSLVTLLGVVAVYLIPKLM